MPNATQITPTPPNPGTHIPRWPSQVAYQDALQHPASCFADPILRTCTPLDFAPFGLPAPISGQFANVYRMRSDDGRTWGVKLFLRHLSSRAVHYSALQTHLLRLSPAPSWLVPFAYHEQGIHIGTNWFPVLQMPWLQEATPLNVYIGEIASDPAAVRRLRDAWRKLIMETERERFVPGARCPCGTDCPRPNCPRRRGGARRPRAGARPLRASAAGQRSGDTRRRTAQVSRSTFARR